MISVHFNGEIVRHMDSQRINQWKAAQRDNLGMCKYGVAFLNCASWVRYCQDRPEIKKLSSYGSCILGGCNKCPRFTQIKKAGNSKKEYSIDWKTYRKIASAAHWMLKEGEHRTVFLTLSFPRWLKEHKLTKSFYYDEISNILFSRFAENLRKNYSCEHYICVKEYGETTNRVHFHLLATMPYISFTRLNKSWVHTIKEHCESSLCALRTDKKKSSIIKNPTRAIRYVCKYVSKCKDQRSSTRIVFISNCTLRKPVKINEVDQHHLDVLRGMKSILNRFKSLEVRKYDYVTTFKITDYREFYQFCREFLYPLYECSVKTKGFKFLPSESPPVN